MLDVALALAAKPKLLLLDEPANHLDLDAMQALETMLRGWPGTLPKMLGAMLMFFLVWSLIAKFALPVVMRWLDQRAGLPRTTTP